MQIHELNNFTGTLGSGAYLAVDDGTDTGKLSTQQLLAATEARIDNIIAGPAPSAEEIVDARLGDDGVTYPSLGDAIRDQVGDLKSDLDWSASLRGLVNKSTNWNVGYINDSGNSVASDNFRRTDKIDVSGQKYLSVYCPEVYTTMFISIYNDDTYVRNMDISNGQLFAIPTSGNKIVINLYFGRSVPINSLAGTAIVALNYLESEVVHTDDTANIDARISADERTKYSYYNLLDYVTLEQGRFDANGNKMATSTQCRTADKIHLPIGSVIDVVALGEFEPHIAVIHQYDVDGVYKGATNIDTFNTYKVATFTTTEQYINIVLYTDTKTVEEAYDLFRFAVRKAQPKLNGKSVSVLGDSLSSYNGFSDSDTAYYPKPNLGLGSVSQMYWAIVANILGLTVDTINAYGGSRVTSPDTNCISSDTRLSALGTPDIILFEAGTNDIYANSPTGEWDGDDIATIDTSTFIPAYTKCLKYMQANYPNAKIIAISPCFITANAESRLYCTIENLQRITEAEKEVCDYMGVKFIDCRKLGMNLSNIADYTVEQLHWNHKFHKLVADKVIETLIQ